MIYFLQSTDGGPIKIGYTDNLEQRRAQLEAHYACLLALLATMDGDREEEKAIHARFAHLRLGRTEQFRPAPDLMGFIGRPLLVDPNPDVIEAMESPNKPVRLDLSVRGHRLLRIIASFEGKSMAAYARSHIEQHLEEEAMRRGIKL